MKKFSLKRVFALFMTAAMLACALTGCGGSSNGGSSDGGDADANGLAGKKITVLLKSYTHMFG